MKGMVYGAESVHGIQTDRKTMTRRVAQIKFLDGFNSMWTGYAPVIEYGTYFLEGTNHIQATEAVKLPYKTGDIVYVKETWLKYPNIRKFCIEYLHKAQLSKDDMKDVSEWPGKWPWKSPRFMPRAAARIFLRITGVRLERLHLITEKEVIMEGFSRLTKDNGITFKYGIADKDGLPGHDDIGWHWQDWNVDFRKAYARLWNAINAKRGYTWDNNDWVLVYTFEKITKEEAEKAA